MVCDESYGCKELHGGSQRNQRDKFLVQIDPPPGILNFHVSSSMRVKIQFKRLENRIFRTALR